MHNLSNTEKVAKFFELQYQGDFDTAFGEYADPDFYWIVSSAENDELRAAIPWAGYRHKGKEGYLELTSQLFGEFDVIEFEPQHYLDGGDRVLVQGHFRFKHKKTGKIADSDWIARFDIKNGKIAGGQFFENTYAVAAARIEN